MKTINRVNAKWMVNDKEIKNCFGYEVGFFESFLKLMKFSNEKDKPEQKRVKICKKHNYVFNIT